MRSGVSLSPSFEPHVWSSSALICTRPTRPAASCTASDGMGPARSITSIASIAAGIPLMTCFWKKPGPALPDGQRTTVSGRPRTCGSMSGATDSTKRAMSTFVTARPPIVKTTRSGLVTFTPLTTTGSGFFAAARFAATRRR